MLVQPGSERTQCWLLHGRRAAEPGAGAAAHLGRHLPRAGAAGVPPHHTAAAGLAGLSGQIDIAITEASSELSLVVMTVGLSAGGAQGGGRGGDGGVCDSAGGAGPSGALPTLDHQTGRCSHYTGHSHSHFITFAIYFLGR